MQRLAETALSDELAAVGKARGHGVAGAVVAIDPRDGGILALASYPNVDPNDFTNGIKESTCSRYLNDPLRPLFDRAIGAATATGSTFKMVTGSAAISAGVIGKDQVLYDSGSWYCHGVTYTDLAAGGLGVTDFIARASRLERRILLPARRPARARPPALLRAAIRFRRRAGHRHSGRIRGELADRRVVAQGLRPAPRAQRRLPTGDRARGDGSDPAADGQHHRHGRQRRDPLPPAPRGVRARRLGEDRAPFGGEIVRHVRHGGIARRGPGRHGSGYLAGRDGYGEDPGVPYGGKTGTVETDGGKAQHDLVRGLRAFVASAVRAGGVHGAHRRLRRRGRAPWRARSSQATSTRSCRRASGEYASR